MGIVPCLGSALLSPRARPVPVAHELDEALQTVSAACEKSKGWVVAMQVTFLLLLTLLSASDPAEALKRAAVTSGSRREIGNSSTTS